MATGRREPPSVSHASSFWPMVACTVLATFGTVSVLETHSAARLPSFATTAAGLLVALGLAGVSIVRQRERRLVRAHDDALHGQLGRTGQLLASARDLTSESSETAVLAGLPLHASRLVPHDGYELALFGEYGFVGRHSELGMTIACDSAPSRLELEVAASGQRAERSLSVHGVVRYELALPVTAAGQLTAVLTLWRTSGSFTIPELDDAAVLCAHAGIALEKARALAQVVSIKREWELLFHSTAEGLALIGRDGTVRRGNDALVALAGPLHAGGAGHHDGWFRALRPERCPICETLRSGKRASRTIVDDQRRTLELTTSPASPHGAVLVVRDVTSIRAADESLRQARQRMFESEKLAAVGRLAAGLSHEVNNPLMGISGLATVLLDEDELAPSTREAVVLIQREARRAARITRDLLQFVHAGEAPTERVDVNELAREVACLRALALQNADVSLVLELAEPSLCAMAASVPLLQVIMNLVTNAEDAVADSAQREIRVITERLPEGIRIIVQDSGTGVPASIRDRLFEPFFTTKSVGKGTGLGLSLCYSIVQRLGGTIHVEDAASGGARFVVELSAYDEGSVQNAAATVGTSPVALVHSR